MPAVPLLLPLVLVPLAAADASLASAGGAVVLLLVVLVVLSPFGAASAAEDGPASTMIYSRNTQQAGS